MDTTAAQPVGTGFAAFRDTWGTQIGDSFPMPVFSPTTVNNYRVKTRAAQVHDVAIIDGHNESALRTTDAPHAGDQVELFVVRCGSWILGGRAVSAGQFLLQPKGRSTTFETAPRTTARIFVLPAAILAPVLRGRAIVGPADSAEVRLLVAHSDMVNATMNELGPAGVDAAHSSLIELAKAVAAGRFDDAEPLLAPAITQAAKDLAERRLTDPSLSAAMLARELHVSPRTLQRAFAAAGELTATAYIRHRRLEQARLALASPSRRMSITEIAARWQFADGSHFTRAFKARYGRTPTEYVRSAEPHDDDHIAVHRSGRR
ncbi:helix-turn-helix transcriptional regulator [Dactylosporangium sp. CA-092794]|uniref:helix-turn-helix transcriptional regulator n=1 Tax=Dactylosporangium sp. CA-092794 TaxID=3239929 RepID=UPI003D922F5F